jgi:tetratricopeptide (TPR) repeat protein
MSEQPRTPMTPDPEMLAAYIDKRLTPEQRAAVEAQLASDPDSYGVLVESMKALDALAGEQRTIPFVAKKSQAIKRWTIAAGLLAAAAALLLVVVQPEWLPRLAGDRQDAQIKNLVAAAGDQRYLEGRLSGGFKYGPLASGDRGRQSPVALKLMAASAEAQNMAADSPKGLRVTGLAKLLVGDVDAGVAALEESVRRGPDASTLADLSAAYLSRSAMTFDEGDLRLALDAAQRALVITPDHPEALYNRALASEKLRMPEAIGFWEAVIAKTSEPGWRDDAQRRLSALRSHPQ